MSGRADILKVIAKKMMEVNPVLIKSHFMLLAYPEASEKTNERLAEIYDELASKVPKYIWDKPTPPHPYVDIGPSDMRLLYCPCFSSPITTGPFAEQKLKEL